MLSKASSIWIQRLKNEGSSEKAAFAQRFFRTGKGQYGEHDTFLGITVPHVRTLAREAKSLELPVLEELLASPLHEVRLFALVVLTGQMQRTKIESEKRKLARWTLAHREALNNWDLVDVSVPSLIGGLPPTSEWTKAVSKLLTSKRLWDRRIAMVSTLGWMRQGSLDECFYFAEQLLNDQEDLMHKAVGWMLREAGKRDRARLCHFLDRFAAQMPRTALRYALEHFSPSQRAFYMARKRGSV